MRRRRAPSFSMRRYFPQSANDKTAHNFQSPEEITRDSSGRLSRPPSFQSVRFFESGTSLAPCHR
jgi:hypothetical protein